MKVIVYSIILLGTSAAIAATNDDCLNGDFSTCREVFNKYGRQTDRTGAVELFEKACSSQALKVTCQVVSSAKPDTLKKMLDLARPDAGSFVINGSKIDKIYQILELK